MCGATLRNGVNRWALDTPIPKDSDGSTEAAFTTARAKCAAGFEFGRNAVG
jgi:hypothetical protein